MDGRTNRKSTILLLSITWLLLDDLTSFGAINFTLTLTPTAISFLDASPTTVSSIPANLSVRVRIRVTGAASQSWSVHALANGDLVSGSGSIPISNISWTATLDTSAGTCPSGCFCSGGTASKLTPQLIMNGQGNTNSTPACTTNYSLANSWSFNAGSYSQTVTFTASAP
jgi:hypothetical protein